GPRHDRSGGTEVHVHEPGAVDAPLGHAAPEIRRAEQLTRVRDGIGSARLEPLRIASVRERIGAQPARIAVGGPDARPAVARLLELERLARKRLADLLGVVALLGPEGWHIRDRVEIA